MLTISKAFTILCLLCMCGHREYPGSSQNKSVSSSFKIMLKYILCIDKLKGEGRFLWSGQAYNYPLKCWGNVNFYLSAHHPILILPVELGNTLAIFKTISKFSFQLTVQVYSLILPKLKRRGKPFLEGARRVATL